MAVCQNLVPLVNIKIAGKCMFILLKMVLIGIDPYPYKPSCCGIELGAPPLFGDEMIQRFSRRLSHDKQILVRAPKSNRLSFSGWESPRVPYGPIVIGDTQRIKTTNIGIPYKIGESPWNMTKNVKDDLGVLHFRNHQFTNSPRPKLSPTFGTL